MGQIELEHPELFALEFGKISESDFVYSVASTNIDQSASNLVNMYVTLRSRISSIMGLHSSIYKCRPISTKHGHNTYDNEISDEFDNGSNPTATSGVICP